MVAIAAQGLIRLTRFFERQNIRHKLQTDDFVRLIATCQASNLRRRGPGPIRLGNVVSDRHTLASASTSFQIPIPNPARKQAPVTVVSMTFGRTMSLPK